MTASDLNAGFPSPTEDQWRALVDKAIKGADFERRLVTTTADSLKVRPLYTRVDAVAGRDGMEPGKAPFIRGNALSTGLGWDIRQVAAESDAVAANAGILDDLQGGATSVLLHVAAPGFSGIGYEQAVMTRALDGVMLDVCPISLVAGELTPDAAGSLMALWRQAGLSGAQCQGAFNYDPLGNLAATGALYHPLAKSLEIAASLMAAVTPMPKVTALRADGHLWHRCGATEAQELGLVAAALTAYLRACEAAGIAPKAALPSIAVTLAADADQFLTIAKFRALRRIIARLAEACGAADAAGQVVLTAETSARMMTARDPWVNMLRTTMAAAAAAMGSANAITVLPYSWPLGLPDSFARRIARNTHHVLLEEAGLGRVADPAGGSWYVEQLTDELAAAAWSVFQSIESHGGLASALEAGFVSTLLAKSRQDRSARIAAGRQALTGTSAFPRLTPDDIKVEPWPTAPSASELNGARITPLAQDRDSHVFEALRDAADKASAAGKRPAVFLASLGPLVVHAARTTWTRNFLAAGGVDGIGGEGWTATPELGAAFAASGAEVACLCSSDDVYGEMGEAAATLLKTTGAKAVYLAGRPREQEAVLKAAGVDDFIYVGVDMPARLGALHRVLGIS